VPQEQDDEGEHDPQDVGLKSAVLEDSNAVQRALCALEQGLVDPLPADVRRLRLEVGSLGKVDVRRGELLSRAEERDAKIDDRL
jgi:hypothetical protein